MRRREALYHQEFIVTRTKESLKKIENSPNVYNVNKCASDLLDQILPELKNWTRRFKKIVIILPQEVCLLFFLMICLIITKKVMILKKLNADADFPPNGLSSFRDEVAKKVDLSGFNGRGKITVIIKFVVDVDGSVTDVAVERVLV